MGRVVNKDIAASEFGRAATGASATDNNSKNTTIALLMLHDYVSIGGHHTLRDCWWDITPLEIESGTSH